MISFDGLKQLCPVFFTIMQQLLQATPLFGKQYKSGAKICRPGPQVVLELDQVKLENGLSEV